MRLLLHGREHAAAAASRQLRHPPAEAPPLHLQPAAGHPARPALLERPPPRQPLQLPPAEVWWSGYVGERVGGRVGGCAMSRFGGSRARNSALQEGSRASCLNHAPDALALLLQPCWEGRGAGAEGGRLGGCTCSGASSRSAWLGWARMPRRASSTAAPAASAAAGSAPALASSVAASASFGRKGNCSRPSTC